MIQTFIVEDDPNHLQNLLVNLQRCCSDKIAVVGQADSAPESVEQIIRLRPDLIFLDIHLRGESTGFNVLADLKASALEKYNPSVIFLSGDHTLDNLDRAIKYAALHFITKPIDAEKLREVVERTTEKIRGQQALEGMEQMQHDLRSIVSLLENDSHDGFITLRLAGSKTRRVRIADITHCEADSVVTTVYFADKTDLVSTFSFSHFRELLIKDYNFFLIDHGLLLNLDQMEHHNYRAQTVLLKNGKNCNVSRRKNGDLKKYLKNQPAGQYAQGKGMSDNLKNLLNKIHRWVR